MRIECRWQPLIRLWVEMNELAPYQHSWAETWSVERAYLGRSHALFSVKGVLFFAKRTRGESNAAILKKLVVCNAFLGAFGSFHSIYCSPEVYWRGIDVYEKNLLYVNCKQFIVEFLAYSK